MPRMSLGGLRQALGELDAGVVAVGTLYNAWIVLAMLVAEDAWSPLAGGGGEAAFLALGAVSALLSMPLAAPSARRRRALLAVSALISAIGALVVLAGLAAGGWALGAGMALLGLAAGMTDAGLFALCCERGANRVSLLIATVTALSALATVPLVLFPLSWSYMIFAFGALACVPFMLPLLAPTSCGAASSEEARSATGLAAPGLAGKVLIANFLVSVCFNLIVGQEYAAPSSPEWLPVARLAANVLACAVLVLYIARADMSGTFALYRVVLPVMVAGMALLTVVPDSGAPAALVCVSLGFSVFDACSWIVLTCLSALDRRLMPLCAGFYAATSFGGMAVASRLGELLSGVLGVSLRHSVTFALALVLVLLFALALVVPRRPFGLDAANLAPARGPAVEEAPVEEAARALGEACGLTQREQEVLLLLVRGRSTQVIAREMGVAEGTAHTHVMHVYQKTGVHGQQELIDLLEDAGRAGSRPAR